MIYGSPDIKGMFWMHISAFASLYCSRWTLALQIMSALMRFSICRQKPMCVRCKGMQHDLRVHFGAWQNKLECRTRHRSGICEEPRFALRIPVPPTFLVFVQIPLCRLAWSSQIPPPRHSFVCGWKVQWACASPKGADEGVTATRRSGLERGEGSCSIFRDEGYRAGIRSAVMSLQ